MPPGVGVLEIRAWEPARAGDSGYFPRGIVPGPRSATRKIRGMTMLKVARGRSWQPGLSWSMPPGVGVLEIREWSFGGNPPATTEWMARGGWFLFFSWRLLRCRRGILSHPGSPRLAWSMPPGVGVLEIRAWEPAAREIPDIFRAAEDGTRGLTMFFFWRLLRCRRGIVSHPLQAPNGLSGARPARRIKSRRRKTSGRGDALFPRRLFRPGALRPAEKRIQRRTVVFVIANSHMAEKPVARQGAVRIHQAKCVIFVNPRTNPNPRRRVNFHVSAQHSAFRLCVGHFHRRRRRSGLLIQAQGHKVVAPPPNPLRHALGLRRNFLHHFPRRVRFRRQGQLLVQLRQQLPQALQFLLHFVNFIRLRRRIFWQAPPVHLRMRMRRTFANPARIPLRNMQRTNAIRNIGRGANIFIRNRPARAFVAPSRPARYQRRHNPPPRLPGFDFSSVISQVQRPPAGVVARVGSRALVQQE